MGDTANSITPHRNPYSWYGKARARYAYQVVFEGGKLGTPRQRLKLSAGPAAERACQQDTLRRQARNERLDTIDDLKGRLDWLQCQNRKLDAENRRLTAMMKLPP